MSRSGWSTSNFLRLGSGVLTAAPLSISAWFNTSITGASQRIVGLWNSAGVGVLDSCFSLHIAVGNTVSAATADATSAAASATSTTISANVWNHGAAVFTSSTSRASYLNGGGKGTNATSKVPIGINRTSIGVDDHSSPTNPFAPAGTGMIAEVGIWNIALSDADVLTLSKGVSPLLVHSEALVAYWPLVGNNSPENNLKSNTATLAIQGALTKAVHPRVILPRRRLVV